MHSQDDRKAIRAVLRGEKDRYREVVERYQGAVYNLMLRTVKSSTEAADLTQETFVKAYERLETFSVSKRFFPWLYAIGMNVARDWLRKNKVHLHADIDDAHVEEQLASENETQEIAQRELDFEKTAHALTQLPLGTREALLLRFKHELSMKEVAETLGVSVSGAKMRVQRGLHALRRLLGEDYE